MSDIYVAGLRLRKPWGTEVLLASIAGFELWELRMEPESATSLHFHRRKATGLVHLHGDGALVIDGRHAPLAPLDRHLIAPRCPHRILAKSALLIWELESPADKEDIQRLADRHGRVGAPFLFGSTILASQAATSPLARMPTDRLCQLLEEVAAAGTASPAAPNPQDLTATLIQQAQLWSAASP